MELLSGREVEGRPLYIREDRTDIEKEEGFVIFVRVTKRRKGSGGGRGRREEEEDEGRRFVCARCPVVFCIVLV
jgi:hypothetical protein